MAKKKSVTIDIRKKQSFFDTLFNKRTHPNKTKIKKCKICSRQINDEPIFCNQFLTRSRQCNYGPLCSDECWEYHMKRIDHY